MISYYLKPTKLKLEQLNDNYLLGTSNGFGQFWVGDALNVLNSMLKDSPELLDDIEIIDTKKQKHSIQGFLDQLSMLKLLNK